ncbi:MAG: hypothetical protein EBV06_05900 [Planctomycetia bacterium]|nr:hypothetical protein [Planctomycetia bacterium]
MSRRSFLVGVGVFSVLIVGFLGGLWLLLRYEPRFYTRLCAPQEHRTLNSQQFYKTSSSLFSQIEEGGGFSATFTEEQVNGYLSEGVHKAGLGDKLFPEGVHEPRLAFEPEHIRLAFRYRSTFVNTVISVSLKAWLPGNESNLLALQLETFKAGLIPISAQWLLEQVSEIGRINGVEVNWYRYEGKPVALLRFQADRAKPNLSLKRLFLDAQTFTIQGDSVEARPGIR